MTNINPTQYKSLINEGVEALIQEQAAKDLLDSISETMEEKLSVPKATAKAEIKKAYKKIYDLEKYNEEKEKLEGIYERLENI